MLAKSNLSKSTFLLFFIAYFTNLHGIVPPKEGKFPTEILEQFAEQEIGITYGDSGWVRKLYDWRNNPYRDAQLEFHMPVLLGKYAGATTYFTAQDFQNNLFDNNPTGTMSDYYNEISHGNFSVDGSTHGWYESTYSMGEAKSNTKQYVSQIAQLADPDVDYAQYDNDGPDNIPNSGDDDGYVDGIAVVYSGCGAEWGPGNNNLWPHMSNLGSYEYTTGDVGANGNYIIVKSYFVSPELAGGGDCYTDIIRPMGVYAHEFGHILGLPDLYDRDDSNGASEGIGNWCLMAGGSWNGWAGDTPAHMSAWCKQEMGWVEPVVLDNDQTGVNITNAQNSPYALKIWEDDYQFSRYFLVENRQKTGYDSELPGDGLMVYHIDENKRWGVNRWSSGLVNDDHNHKLVDVEAADGAADMDNGINRGDVGDTFPGSSGNYNFSNTTNPNSNRYGGVETDVKILNISSSQGSMTADINIEPKKGMPIVYDPTGISGYGWGYSTPADSWAGVLFTYPSTELNNGYLTEVDLGFKSDGNSFTLYVYESFDGFTPGTLLFETSGNAATSGWHSVAIDSIMMVPGSEFFVAYKLVNQAYAISFENPAVPAGRSYFSGDGVNYSGSIGNSYNINIRAKLRNQVSQDDIIFQPATKEELQTAVDLWVSDNATALATYGEINAWDVSLITDMSELFRNKTTFDDDISTWDVSNVTDMTMMFEGASSFNGDISNWDVSSVITMRKMFLSAFDFNGDISSWDVSNVTNLQEIFYDASSFNGDISSWDVSNVTNMWFMFTNASSFNGDMSNWDVSNVTDMRFMFANASSFNGDISSWNVSNVTNMQNIFSGADALSDENKCAIHTSWASNDAWPYDWSEFCSTTNNTWSLSFDGENDYVGFNVGVLPASGDYTVQTWAKHNGPTGNGFNHVVSQHNNFYLGTNSNNVIRVGDHWGNTGIQYPLDSWTNIAVVKSATDTKLYINGELAATQNGEAPNPPSDNFYIGKQFGGIGEYWFGNIHEVSVFSTALNESEIVNYMMVDLVGDEEGLVGLWNFNEGSGEVLHDLSVNGNNGTIYGATWSSDVPLTSLSYVSIPDQNFEQKLIDLGYDDVLDGQVLSTNISEVEYLNVSDAEIADITGIGGFTNLKSLEIRNNSLTSLDLSAVPLLEQLWADRNNLNSINVSSNAQLTYLHLYMCGLTNMDLSQNINLRNLIIPDNSIANLDLSNNSELLELRASGNDLTEIDLTNNLQLENLSISNNPIETLDVSYLTSLRHLNIESMGLTQIDVTNNTLLEHFRVGFNELTSLDISSNANLTLLYVYNNSLTELDLSQNLMLSAFSAGNTGISNYDLSNNLQLTEIYLQNNGVTSIDLTLYPELAYLDLHGNELISLDLSNNPLLHYVNLHNNQLTTLDLSDRPNLQFLHCHSNSLEMLNLKHGSDQFEQFNATANPDLNCIEVLDVAYHEERFTFENNSLDEGVVFNEECGPVALVNPESYSEILYDHESVVRTLTISNAGEFPLEWQLSRDSEGSLDLLSSAGCVDEYSDTDCGWGLVAFENAGFRQNLKYLGVDGITDTDNAGNIGHLLGDYSSDVLIVAGDKYYKFASEENIFTNTVDPFIDLHNFESNDDQLNTWVEQDGGLKFCRGSEYPDVRPGDTSWGLIPNGSAQRDCGCNSGGWSGYGTYYGGFESGCTSCGCQGGGWTGTKASGQNKGNGGYANVDLAIYVRSNSDWLATSLESGSVAPGQEVSVDVTINATGLSGGEYSSALLLTSNDYDNPEIVIPVDLTVLETMVWGSLSDTSMAEDSGLQIQLQLNTSDEYELSISSDTLALETDVIGNTFYFTPIENWNGTSFIDVTLNTNDQTLTDSFLLTVNEVNDAPIASDGYFELDEDYILTGSVEADDGDPFQNPSDQQELTFTSLVEFQNGSYEFGRNDGVLVYTPNENFNGVDTMVYQVMDSGTTSGQSDPRMDSALVVVIVNPLNDAPTIEDIPNQEIDEDNTLRLAIESSDIDGDNTQIHAHLDEESSGLPVELFVFDDGDSLLIVPGLNWNGSAIINVVVSDGLEDAVATFNLLVNPVDDDPFMTGYLEDIYFYEDFEDVWMADLNDLFEDIDGALDFTITFDNELVGHELNNGMLHLFSLDNLNGVANMVVTAYNPRMRTTLSDEAMITIFAVNDPPFINEIDVIVGEEDGVVPLWSMESLFEDGIIGDVDDGEYDLQYHLYMDSDMINIDWDNNFNSYPVLIPEPNYNGSSILVICVSDGEYEECRDVEVVFNSINDLPFFTSEMESPIGRDLDFHLELNFEDIDDPYEDLSLSIVNSPDWVILDGNSLHGNASVDLGYYEVVLQLQDLSDVLIDTFGLHVENFIPEITQIVDIPDDQGGRVYLTFNASFFDNGETNGQSYGLFRYDDMGDGFFDWTQLTSVDAIGEPQYTFEAITLVDSTFESDGITTFKILASTVGGLFYSEEFSGYSIDNISPVAPSGLVANAITDGIMLNWNANDDEDFSHYVLERSISVDFMDYIEYEVSDTIYIDLDYVLNQSYFYRIAALDISGNKGEYSEIIETILLSTDGEFIPAEFALHQNYPNPFNPHTQIKYDLANDAMVHISIYDIMGRKVRDLISSHQDAGYWSIEWDATNHMGESVSAGMYIYVIEAGSFKANKKMILLK